MGYTASEMSAADIAAITNGNRNGYNDGLGGDGWWLILLFLFLLGNNGWNNGNNGCNGGGGGFVPYALGMGMGAANDVQRGFDQSAVISAIGGVQNSVTSGFGDTALGLAGVNQNICQTGNGITAAVTNGFAAAEAADNARQMATMTQNFNSQSALMAQLNNMAMTQQNCCCEGRAQTADLKYTIATENCEDRAALSNGVRDIIANQNANNQVIIDKLCQLEMDGIKQNYENRIAAMQNALDAERSNNQALRFVASQDNQTAQILAGQATRAAQVEQYVNPTAVPAYVVPNPNCCPTNYTGCGCNTGCNTGCNGAF